MCRARLGAARRSKRKPSTGALGRTPAAPLRFCFRSMLAGGADAGRGKAVDFAERGKSGFQLFSGGAALAADAQHADAGDKVQRISGREKGQGEVCCVLRLGRELPCRSRAGRKGKFRPDGSGLSGQQFPADGLDPRRFQHLTILMLRPLVHSKKSVGIRRRGNDRHRPAERRKLACQIVGPAQMAGQDRHREASAFVQHDHGGVAGFAFGNGVQWPAPQCQRLPQIPRHPSGQTPPLSTGLRPARHGRSGSRCRAGKRPVFGPAAAAPFFGEGGVGGGHRSRLLCGTR